jgi:hypothetical protein
VFESLTRPVGDRFAVVDGLVAILHSGRLVSSSKST